VGPGGRRGDVADRWRESHPAVAEKPEEGLEATLPCYAFPSTHQKRIRTTNGLERLNQEIKRRTRLVRIFPNPDSCLRLVTALFIEQSEKRASAKRYLDMTLLEDPNFGDETREGVMELAA
jgi:putative transposase